MMQYLYIIAIFAAINVILASGFNLILGYGGLVSVAHPIFYAIGAYASALLAQKLGVPILFAILLGALVAATTSMFVSLPSLRVSGDYLVWTPPHHQQC
jgi:branched-chain amino acid transport system permease protein